MRFRPVNPDTSHPNHHTLYLAASGGGKSQALSQNKAIPARGARVIMWDQSGDHRGLHYESKAGFIRALRIGLKRGGGFRVGFAGAATVDNWEWFCEVVWSVLDGNYKTYLIAEELSAVCVSVAKATPNAAHLLNQGRKFGLVFHGTTQKAQEISKTYYDQTERRYVGRQKTAEQQQKMAKETGALLETVKRLQPLEFIYDDGGGALLPKIITLKYKKVTGVQWPEHEKTGESSL